MLIKFLIMFFWLLDLLLPKQTKSKNRIKLHLPPDKDIFVKILEIEDAQYGSSHSFFLLNLNLRYFYLCMLYILYVVDFIILSMVSKPL